LGLGLPYVVLYILKFLGAKIRRPQNVMAKRFQVQVTPGVGLELAGGGQIDPNSLAPGVDALRGSPKGERSVMADGLELRVAYGLSPYGLGHVKVVAPGLVGASSTERRPKGKDRHAALPLDIAGAWAVLVDPAQAASGPGQDGYGQDGYGGDGYGGDPGYGGGAGPGGGFGDEFGGAPPAARATLLVLASIVNPDKGAQSVIADAQGNAGDVIERLATAARESPGKGKAKLKAKGKAKEKKPKKTKGAAPEAQAPPPEEEDFWA
jgi:hypothetical protein